MKSIAPGHSASPSPTVSEASLAHRPETGKPKIEMGAVRYDTNHYTGTWGSVFAVIWRGTTTVEAAKALATDVRQWARRRPSGRAALVMVFEEDAAPLTPDAQTALANVLRFNADDLVCLAVCGPPARTVSRALQASARPPFAVKSFGSAREGIDWTSRALVGEGLSCGDPADFEQALGIVRPRTSLYPR